MVRLRIFTQSITVPSNSTCNALHFSHHMKLKVWYWSITKSLSTKLNCHSHVVHTFLVLVTLIFVCTFCQLDKLHHDHVGLLLLHHFSNDLKLQNNKNFRTENGLSPGVTNMTLKMTSTQVVETTVTNNKNSPSQESTHQGEPYFFKEWKLCVQYMSQQSLVKGLKFMAVCSEEKHPWPKSRCHYGHMSLPKINNNNKNISYLILWLHSLSL